ncbi:MAG: PAS domain-containing protein [Thermodesulfobacteriota bacterium]|nr:PAS domain-containing protein [Thermodesulfobacteriota bacterium]
MTDKPSYEELEQRVKKLEKEASARRQAQEALKGSEQKKSVILDSLLEHVVYQDVDMNVLWANQAACHSAGLTREDLIGRHCYEVWGGPEGPCEDCPVIKARDTGQPHTVEKMTPDGRWWHIEGYPVRNDSGQIVAMTELTLEVTMRKRVEEALFNSHEKLRSLASELSLAEERERRRVATEVHDRINQNLAFVKMKLGKLRASTSSSSVAGIMDEVLKLVDETIQNARALVSELGSSILYELGFVPAVEWLTQQAERQHGIVVDFEDDGQPKPLSEDVRVLLFQAARELLVNIAKHAKARTAKVSITRDGNQVRVDVEDDGVGFDIAEIGPSVDTSGKFGLFSIRMRLEPLGGHTEVDSKPGQRTRVALIAPLKHNGKNKKQKVS